FSVDLVQPRRPRKFGLMPSKPYRSVTPLPAAVGTCSQMKVWGLVQSNCSTVPVTVLLAWKSNMAKEWWARAGAAAPAARARAATAMVRRAFIEVSYGAFLNSRLRPALPFSNELRLFCSQMYSARLYSGWRAKRAVVSHGLARTPGSVMVVFTSSMLGSDSR